MRRARGFTLMEMLVTLIVSALAVTLMFQALASFNRSRERAAALEGVRNNKAVLAGWIGDSIRGIVAVDPASLPVSHQGDPKLVSTATVRNPVSNGRMRPPSRSWRKAMPGPHTRSMYPLRIAGWSNHQCG